MTTTPEPTTDTPTAARWQDSPRYHTAGQSMADKLRLLAAAFDSLGETVLAQTWMSIDLQVTGDADPVGRKAAVDAITAALGLNPASGGRNSQYTATLGSVTVYTDRLHQPGCCEHCTVAGS